MVVSFAPLRLNPEVQFTYVLDPEIIESGLQRGAIRQGTA